MLLRAILAIGTAVSPDGDLAPVLENIAVQARAASKAAGVQVFLADGRGGFSGVAAAGNDGDAPETALLLDHARNGGEWIGEFPAPWAHLAACVLPMRAAERSLGAVVIWRAVTAPFTAEELTIVRVVMDSAAWAIAQTRTVAELHAHAARMETLTEVSRIISAETDHHALYDAVFAQCQRLLGVEHFYLAFLGTDGALCPLIWSSHGERIASVEGKPLPPGLGLAVIHDNAPINVADVGAEYARRGLPTPPLIALGSDESTFSLPWMGVPIRAGDHAVGVIATNGRATPYTDDECAVLYAIAAQVGVAARNLDLLAQQRDRTTRLRTLTDISRAISAMTDLDTLYEAVHRECARLFSVANFYIAHQPDGTGDLVPDLWYTDGKRLRELEGEPLEGGLSFIVARTRQLFAADDYLTECRRLGIPIYYPTLPDEAPSAWMGAPIIAGERLLGVVVINGKPMPYTEDEREAFIAIANQVSVAITNAQLLVERERRADRLTRFVDLSREISAELEIAPLIRVVARECTDLFQLQRIYIGYHSSDTAWMDLITMDGTQPIVPLPDLVADAPLCAFVARTRVTVAERDYEAACRRRGLVPKPPEGIRLPAGWIGAPMFTGGRFVGVITGFLPAEQATPENAQVLSILANQAAVAIENAHLYHGALHLGVVEERNRLAREIHDTIAQGLTATTYQLELADTFLTREPPDLERTQQKVHRALQLTRDNLTEARRSVVDLRAAQPQGASLIGSLERLGTDFTSDNGTAVSVVATEGFPRLPVQLGAGFYRMAQEALANVAKHAHATHVTIVLSVEGGNAMLSIYDDGVGFDPAIVAAERTARGTAGGFGLIGIRERAQLLGGAAEIASDEGAGTHLVIRVPLGGGRGEE